MPRTGYEIKLASTTAELKQLVASDGKAEYRLHCQIIDLLKLSGVTGLWYWHTPNGGKRHVREAAKLRAMGVVAGVSDLALSIPGVGMAFVEIKAGKGRLSVQQQVFLEAMKAHGHRTAVVKSVEQAVELFTAWRAVAKVRVVGMNSAGNVTVLVEVAA